MSLVKRLHLDEVVSSFPTLGPTAPDGGYSWIVLLGVILIQITVPSILSMYGVVLGYITINNAIFQLNLWEAKIILTPVLFVAFWSLADPWTEILVQLAPIPRVIGLIGVFLLSTSVIASGYLATGGEGAYLASLSAGMVMGIGASLVILESESVLRKHFRVRLPLVLTVKNVATSMGFVIVPPLTHFLLVESGLKSGILLMTIVFVPTILGTLTFHTPSPPRAVSPYRLLLSADEDNELGIRISSDRESESEQNNGDVRQNNDDVQQNNGVDNAGYENGNNGDNRDKNVVPLFGEANDIHVYQDEDVELFINLNTQPDSNNKWKQEFRAIRYFRFWSAVVTWIGIKAGSLYFWILVPATFLQRDARTSVYHSDDWTMLLVAAGLGSFGPSIASYWSTATTAQYRRIYFGSACWLSSIIMLGLSYINNYYWFLTYSLLSGISMSSLLTCQDLTLRDVLGNQFAHQSHKLFSTLVGLGVLTFCFVHSENACFRLVAGLQFLGGCYWTIPPIWDIVKARRLRNG